MPTWWEFPTPRGADGVSFNLRLWVDSTDEVILDAIEKGAAGIGVKLRRLGPPRPEPIDVDADEDAE